jgi:hypothetical protein
MSPFGEPFDLAQPVPPWVVLARTDDQAMRERIEALTPDGIVAGAVSVADSTWSWRCGSGAGDGRCWRCRWVVRVPAVEHVFQDGLHTYTARADSTLVNEVWRGLQDLAPYPDDPRLNPMDLFGIGNFAGERLAVWRAVAWADFRSAAAQLLA